MSTLQTSSLDFKSSSNIYPKRGQLSADLTVISPLSWVQEAFRGYFDKAHMTDSSQSRMASARVNSKNNEPKPTATSAIRPQSGNPTDYWKATYDYGFEPARGVGDDAAVWITPDLLIANNAWRERKGLPPLLFEAPAADWLETLPWEFTRRKVLTAPVSQIRSWTKLPDGLGERPWSQLSGGRVPEFRAARRNLRELQDALRRAPDDSLITVNTHIDGIGEEWCVIVDGGKAVESCGYCVHRSLDEDSHDVLTVFDGARFHESYRTIAESFATQAAQASHLDNASIIVGFRNTSGVAKNAELANAESTDTEPANVTSGNTERTNGKSEDPKSANTKPANAEPANPEPVNPRLSIPGIEPIIIEADPTWCTTPYPYETTEATNAFLKAISDSRIYKTDDGIFKNRNGQSVPATAVYAPDPWMARHAAHRYDRF